MTILVIAEHDNSHLNPNTLNTLSAATKIGTEISLLVAGNNTDSVVAEAQSIGVVSKVLVSNNPALADGLARNGQLLLVAILHEPISINSRLLIRKRASIQGWPCGSGIDSEATMNFSAQQLIRPHIEKYALENINEAWDQMITNKARFRVVIDMTGSQ